MIAVIGCGRVGLPLALLLANKGFQVIGIDGDPQKIAMIRNGKIPFMEKGLENLLIETAEKGLFTVTDKLATAINKVNTFIITVGTDLSVNFIPKQSEIMNSIQDIVSSSSSGSVTIILRSTVSPGTCDSIRRNMKEINIKIGRDLFFAYCPERIAEGNAIEELGTLPQLMGAFDKRSVAKAQELFSALGIKCIIGSPLEVEFAKVFNNMYRYVNFALANECMFLAEKNEASIRNILKMCNEDYPRGGPWLPGYTAGPCLFKDGFFIINQLLFPELVLTSWKINESLPEIMLKEIEQIRPLNQVAILGLAYKAEVDDCRNSLAIKLCDILKSRGVRLKAHDPYVDLPWVSNSLEQVLSGSTEIFIMVPHNQYKKLTLKIIEELAGMNPIIIDPWFLWSNRVITKFKKTN